MNPSLKNNNIKYLFYISGLLITSYSVFVFLIAPDFTYAAEPSQEDLVSYIIVRIFIGIVYTFSVILVVKKQLLSTGILVSIFLVGFAARLILVPTEPILEDDFNRYLWDGAVTANGYNPYKHPPKLFIDKDPTNISTPKDLLNLADSSGSIIEKINHPHIRTIYPPVAQFAFALTYLANPWSISIWKALLLLIDMLVFYLLLKVLKKMKIQLTIVIIYWWNPILLHEIFNAGHMDLLMYPLIVGAVLFYLKDNIIASTSLLSLGIGVKIWPIVLIPFVLKKVTHNKKIILSAIAISSGIVLLILFPIIITKLDNSLGFVTYSKNWTNNESIFQFVNILVKQIISIFKINYHCSLCAARWVVILFYAGVIIVFVRNKKNENSDIIRKLFYAVAILFLISPTQFPWYYTWALPLLVLSPRLSFVAYTILLPLYQLKYSWPYLVWVEHIPIIILFIVELVNPRIGKYLLPKQTK